MPREIREAIIDYIDQRSKGAKEALANGQFHKAKGFIHDMERMMSDAEKHQ